MSAASRPAHGHRAAVWTAAASAFAVYAVLAVAATIHLWLGHPATVTFSTEGDVAQQLWFLEWWPHALVHHLAPWSSSIVEVGSGGVNVLANTSLALPALLLAPLTLLAGPIASFNLAVTVAPLISAMAMWVLARRLSPTAPRFVHLALGAAWGFSPALLSHLHYGHLQLTIAPIPPLLVLVVLEALDGWTPRRTGLTLAALLVVQYGIGAEMALMEVLGAAAVLVTLAVVDRGRLTRLVRVLAPATPWVLGCCALVLGGPVAYELVGPRHLSGPPWRNTTNGVGLADFVSAPRAHHVGSFLDTTFGYFGNLGAPVGYLGWPVVATLVVVAVTRRGDRVLRAALVATGLVAVASLGSDLRWTMGGRVLLSWAPWRVVAHLPVLDQLSVARLASIVDLGVLVALAIATERRGLDPAPAVRARTTAVTGAVALACLAPLVLTSGLPFATSRAGATPAAVRSLAANHATVLVLPFPSVPPGESSPMAWQATTGDRLRLLGSYLAAPVEGTSTSAWVLAPRGIDGILLGFGTPLDPHPVPASSLRALASIVESNHVDAIVLDSNRLGPDWLTPEVTQVVGQIPTVAGSVAVFSHLHRASLRHGGFLGRAALARCAAAATVLARAQCALAGGR